MPYGFPQIFPPRKGTDEPRDETSVIKKMIRRQSTSVLLKKVNRPDQNELAHTIPRTRKLSAFNLPRGHSLHKVQRSSVRDCPVSTDLHQPFHKQRLRKFASSLVAFRRPSVSNSQPTSPLQSPKFHRLRQTSSDEMTHCVSDGLNNKQMKSPNGKKSENNASHDEENHQPANVENLVRKCAECFDDNGNCSNEEFLRNIFLTHIWFMTSEQLMVLFTQLYEHEKTTEGYGKKIFFAVRYWMKVCPHMFDLDLKLLSALNVLRASSQNDPDVDSSIIDLRSNDSYSWMKNTDMSVRPNRLDRKKRKVSLVFNHLVPEEIANHMSYLEYKSFRRLTLADFHNYAMHGAIKNNLKLERAVFLFNNLTHWVQCMILDHPKPLDRAQAIVKFIEVAKKLHTIRNFNTLMAIVGALTHSAISRLKKTMALVPKDSLKTLDEFIELLDSKSNYCSYRRAYSHVTNEFKIPIIGILMKDLIALHAALPDRVGDGMINVRKMMMIGGIFQELMYLQMLKFPYPVNHDLVNTLRVSLYLYYNEEEIYQLSLSREPRDAKHSSTGSNSSPSKLINMGFGEFASFTCQLGDDTIKQHVTAMVQSVFKTYDENTDGFISEVEFGHFIQNFPGLDSFSTVDKDRDGQISKEEMIDYFLKISSRTRIQVCQGFKHDFTETTYFHPTFCEECEKLLWGLVKQGWKCRDCGINCHKHCKDRIVLECRQKTNSKASNSQATKKRQKFKDKTSTVSSESDYSMSEALIRAGSTNDDEAFEESETKNSQHSPTVQRSTPPVSLEMNSGKPKLQSVNESQNVRYDADSLSPRRSSQLLNCQENGKPQKQKLQPLFKKSSASGRQVSLDGPAPVSSFLYGKSCRMSSPLRHDSCDFDTANSFSKDLEKLQITNEDDDNIISTAASTNKNKLYSRSVLDRRDSGVSSCNALTLHSFSAPTPTTPPARDHPSTEVHFQYACPECHAVTSSKTAAQLSSTHISGLSDDQKLLLRENEKLRKENEDLLWQVQHANDVIRQLQMKLASYTSS